MGGIVPPADIGFVPAAAGGPGLQDTGKPGFWRVPGSGTPAQPGEAVQPNTDALAAAIARKLTVPRGPTRTVNLLLGLSGGQNGLPFTISATALNSKITQPVLGGPGVIRSFDLFAPIAVTGPSAGVLQLFDQDVNSPLLRTFPFIFGAAGTFQTVYSIAGPLNIPFLGGITAIWTPITAAFSSGIICMNIDFDSIPIGEKMEFSQ